MQRVFVNPLDAKRFIALPNVTKYLRSVTLVTLQCMLTPNCITEKEWEVTFNQLVTKLESAGPPGNYYTFFMHIEMNYIFLFCSYFIESEIRNFTGRVPNRVVFETKESSFKVLRNRLCEQQRCTCFADEDGRL